VMHQWYFLIIAPFLPFFRSLPWLALFAAIAATFVTRIHQIETGGWYDAPLARFVEYGTFLAFWSWGLFKGRVTGPGCLPAPETVSVIIPVLNESAGISECISSVQSQVPRPMEIIVVDGGSDDDTRERVRAMEGVLLLESDRGRGIQISAGVERAGGDVILVLHGDSRLMPGAIGRMRDWLKSNPAAVGGAFGHAFEGGAVRPALIAILDNLRACLLGISFGNQAQFFRRGLPPGGFPSLRLMEDVELSFRMKVAGAVLFIPRGVRNRPRRWEQGGYFENIRLVLSLCGRFILARRLGRIAGDCEELYERYYTR
jgi:glycosyltransferase involved in cell wall biosynthesis